MLGWSVVGLLLYCRSGAIVGSSCWPLSWGDQSQIFLQIHYIAFFFFPLSLLTLSYLQLAENSNQHLRNMALDALDESICAVLGSDQFPDNTSSRSNGSSQSVRTFTSLRPSESSYWINGVLIINFIPVQIVTGITNLGSLECAVISPLRVLYLSTQSVDSRTGSLKILLHVLEVLCDLQELISCLLSYVYLGS